MNQEIPNHLNQVRNLIDASFSLAEIRALCFELGIDYEHLVGEEKQSKVISLLYWIIRRNQIERFVSTLRKLRQNINWPDTISDNNLFLNTRVNDLVPLEHLTQAEYFIDRETDMRLILQDIAPGKTVTISGPSGVGKTAFTAKVIEALFPQHTSSYLFPDGLICFSFDKKPKPDQLYEHIIMAYTGNLRHTTSSLQEFAEVILSKKSAFIVIDGISLTEQIRAILSILGPQCGALLTTSSRQIALGIHYSLLPLTREDAAILLRKWAKSRAENDIAVMGICDFVGGYPLAIRLIGHYLDRTYTNADEYLDWLYNEPIEALDQVTHHGQSIVPIILRNVSNVSTDAKEALVIIGLQGPTSFDKNVIRAVLGLTDPKLQEVLNELVEYGLLIRKMDRYQVIHQIVHTFCKGLSQLSFNDRLKQLLKLRKPKFVIRNSLLEYYRNRIAHWLESDDYYSVDLERIHITALLAELTVNSRVDWKIVRDIAKVMEQHFEERGHRGHWQERQEIIEAGLTASNQLKDNNSKQFFLGRLGQTYYYQGDPYKAIDHYRKALQLTKTIGNESDHAEHLSRLATVYRETGDNGNAIKCCTVALDISQRLNDLSIQATSLGNLGSTFLYSNQIDKAISCYEKAHMICESINDVTGERNQLNNLGLAYTKKGDLETALKYSRKALVISEEINDLHGMVANLGNLGNVYRFFNETHKSIEYFQEAISVSKQIGYRAGTAFNLGNLGNVYLELEKWEKAIECYQEGLQISEAIASPLGQINHLYNLARAHEGISKPLATRAYRSRAQRIRTEYESEDQEKIEQESSQFQLIQPTYIPPFWVIWQKKDWIIEIYYQVRQFLDSFSGRRKS